MDLWRQRVIDGRPEGEPERVTTGIGMTSAAFSPDGKKLAYSRGRAVSNVWRVPSLQDRPATWADAQQITFDEAYIEMLDVSPDGRRLLISSDRAGNPDLWMLPAGGGEMEQVTTDPTPDWAPVWSLGGEEIAFYAFRSGNRQIWVQPVAGGTARQLTHGEVEHSEVEHLDHAIGPHHYVLRLHVSVNDAAGMSGRERRCDLNSQADRPCDIEVALGKDLPQSRLGDELRRHEPDTVDFADVEDGRDIRVVDDR